MDINQTLQLRTKLGIPPLLRGFGLRGALRACQFAVSLAGHTHSGLRDNPNSPNAACLQNNTF